MKIVDVLKSGKLSKKGALRLIESLLDGETQVNVNDDIIDICYGQSPQNYASYESVTGFETVEEFAQDMNDGYGCMSEPYENLKLIANILGINLEEVTKDDRTLHS